MKVVFVSKSPHFTVGSEYTVTEEKVEMESLTPLLYIIYDCDMLCLIGHEIEPGMVRCM